VDLFFFLVKKTFGIRVFINCTFKSSTHKSPQRKRKVKRFEIFLLDLRCIFFAGDKNKWSKGFGELYLQIFNPQITPRKQ